MFTFLNDAEDDPFFGPHMRHMRQMNSMMSSMMDPFGMLGGMGGAAGMLGGMGGLLGGAGGLLGGMPRHSNSLMPFMPPMNMNRMLTGGMEGGMMPGSSYSSSTVVMSSGMNGRPQVISSTSSTKVGPGGLKETRRTHEDSRTGTKRMAVGHHIGERAHVIEREQNALSGEREERQEFINLDEEEADEFDREFQEKAGGYMKPTRAGIGAPPLAIGAPPLAIAAPPLAIAAPPAPAAAPAGRRPHARPAPRRPIRLVASPLASPTTSASVRELYSGAHPQRHRGKHQRAHHAARHSPDQ